MTNLRPLSSRPEVLVDGTRGAATVDPQQNFIGIAALLGRGRLLYALPTNGSVPMPTVPRMVLHGLDHCYPADPAGNMIGERNELWIARMLAARWTEDTRRLAG
jgi:hypothetical protein